jgi:hypothetical protein
MLRAFGKHDGTASIRYLGPLSLRAPIVEAGADVPPLRLHNVVMSEPPTRVESV